MENLFEQEESKQLYNEKHSFEERLNDDIDKYTLRDIQVRAQDHVENVLENEKNVKFFLMELPVGSGKSLFAMNFIKWFLKNKNKNMKFDLVTNSKLLQQQYTNEFTSITNLWGKDNYTCSKYNTSCKEGKEFNALNDTECEFCPYDCDRTSYMNDTVSLTNFQMFDIFNIFIPDMVENQRDNNKVLIIDEAHEFEEVFSSFITVGFSPKTIKKYDLPNESVLIARAEQVTNLEEAIDFLKLYKVNLNNKLDDHKKTNKDKGFEYHKRDKKVSKFLDKDSEMNESMKKIEDIKTYIEKITNFLNRVNSEPHNWIFEKIVNPDNPSNVTMEVTPLWSNEYMNSIIWKKYDYIIMMSGTILDKKTFCFLNGLPDAQTTHFSTGSPFPIKNRPVYYMPTGKMTYNLKDTTFKSMSPFIEKLVNKKHPNDKGIIHTHTYQFASWVTEAIDNDRFLTHDTTTKMTVLERHSESKIPSVLVSPSMSTGIDLKDDLSRFQIIMKVPFPSLASAKVNMRKKENPTWYAWLTLCIIIQMTGRSIRNHNDYAATYILDSSFGDLMRFNGHLFPEDFRNCLISVNMDNLKG